MGGGIRTCGVCKEFSIARDPRGNGRCGEDGRTHNEHEVCPLHGPGPATYQADLGGI